MLYKWSLSPQSSIVELRKTGCVASDDCRNKHQSWLCSSSRNMSAEIMELRQTGWFTISDCRHKHQSWSCAKLDALQVLPVATSIKHGTEQNTMLYKCSLSPRASTWSCEKPICFTSARCRTKHQTWSCEQTGCFTIADCRNKQLDALQVLAVATKCLTSAHCRHKHPSWSCEQLHALQVLTVAISLHPGSGVSAWAGVAKSRTCEQLDVLQVLAVATNSNQGAAKHLMLYKCWLSSQASIMELRINIMLYKCSLSQRA